MPSLLATIFRKPQNKLQKKRRPKKRPKKATRKDIVTRITASIKAAAIAGACGLAAGGGFVVGVGVDVAPDDAPATTLRAAPDVGNTTRDSAAPAADHARTSAFTSADAAGSRNQHRLHIYPFVARVNDRGEVIDFQSSGDIEQWVDAFYETDRRASAPSAVPALKAQGLVRRTSRPASEGADHDSGSETTSDF